MTKKEARAQYLRFLGEATVNGGAVDDADLADVFEQLLYPAMVQVAASFPSFASVRAEAGEWRAPEGFTGISRAYGEAGEPVSFIKNESGRYVFAGPCTVVYTRLPQQPDPAEGDGAALDVEERAVQLVPIQAAIYAAMGQEEYAYKVSFLTAAYNAVAAFIRQGDAPSYRRVFAV